MGVLGSLIAVLPGKMIFGGLGHNVFNPAVVEPRHFVQAAFPVAISTYCPPTLPHRFSSLLSSTLAFPLMKATPDGFSGATPLAQAKFEHLFANPWRLFLGLRAGSIGETCMPLILLCGIYLIVRKMMDWRIPAAMLLGAVAMAGIFRLSDPKIYPGALFVLFSGGLMLSAMFMATDPVASPVTPRGMWIYGILMGVVTVLIRFKGGLSEGVMYAILLGNALSPLIDNLTQPRTYGERKKSLLERVRKADPDDPDDRRFSLAWFPGLATSWIVRGTTSIGSSAHPAEPGDHHARIRRTPSARTSEADHLRCGRIRGTLKRSRPGVAKAQNVEAPVRRLRRVRASLWASSANSSDRGYRRHYSPPRIASTNW